jgi:hypothetical protein
MKRNMLVFFGYILLLLVVSGCNQDSQVAEQILEKIEAAANLETTFAEKQEPLVELEVKEQSLYDEMKELGLGEIDKIIQLATEASTYAEERKALVAQENEAIEASYQKFNEINTLEEQLEEELLKEKLIVVKAEMDNRYNSYQSLNKLYNETVALDQQFYELFQREDLKIEEIQQIIDDMNSNYQQILQLKDEFNAYTHAYNEAKIEFYKAANFEVVVNE